MKRKRGASRKPVTAATRRPAPEVVEDIVLTCVGSNAKAHTGNEHGRLIGSDNGNGSDGDGQGGATGASASNVEGAVTALGCRKRKRRKGAQRKAHAEAVSAFHMLQRLLAKAREAGDTAEQARVQTQIDKLGGLPAYQQYSQVGAHRTGSFNTSRWVVKMLAKGHRPASGQKLRLLDVGALDHNYRKETSWIACSPIDLHAQTPAVRCVDFFDLELPPDDSLWDVVCLCLVINFVPDPKKRGDMLRRCTIMLRPGGLLFVVLPLACIENSRFLNERLMVDTLQALGFELKASHRSKKLCFFMCALRDEATVGACDAPRRRCIRVGENKNNFWISLE
eukprot:m.234086 g.234086  ORF g.234086 m.234086 type:complete len:337 (+) comp18913_c0_seq1:1439-2449(+)